MHCGSARQPVVAAITIITRRNYYGQVEERLVQRTHGPVAGQEFFHTSGTGSAPGTVQVPGDISVEDVSFFFLFTAFTYLPAMTSWIYGYELRSLYGACILGGSLMT